MISAELRAKIRRLYYAEHWKVGTIASELGVHEDTVKLAIESDRFAPRARPVRATLLDPYKDFIAKTLEQYPRLRATRLYEMLEQRGYAGSVIVLRRYVKTVRPGAQQEAYMRLETLPGEQAQVDWGHFGSLMVGAAKRVLSCFVMVLAFSRALFARFFLDQKNESFMRGHVEAFEAFDGVPRIILYDNLKSVVLERDGQNIRFHPRILELAGHYHFAPRPCSPYRGNEKGKVERTIQYLRHSFFAARQFRSLDDLNAQLRQWIAEVANTRPVPGDPSQRPITEAFTDEQPRLLPLPENPFPTDLVQPIRSGKTPYVRFDKNDYSIPHTLIRQPLTLVVSESRVRLLDSSQQQVADHGRSYDRGQRIEDADHIRSLARHKRRATEQAGRHHIMYACPHAAPFFAELCARDEPISSHTRRLGRLLDTYGARDLDQALKQAIERGAISAASVAYLLDKKRREQNQPPVLMSDISRDPRVQSLRVRPHSLAPYDKLTNFVDDSDERDSNDDDNPHADRGTNDDRIS